MLKDKCPNNWKEQLNDFNNLLKKYGYFIDDVHSKNLASLNIGPSPQISFILPLSFASLLYNHIDQHHNSYQKNHLLLVLFEHMFRLYQGDYMLLPFQHHKVVC